MRFADGSQKVGRGGHESELRLVLVEPMSSTVASHVGLPTDETVYELAAGIPVGAPTLIAGPSRGQQVACLNTGHSGPRPPTDQSACITDEFGEIVVRYRVPTEAIDLFAMQQDLLRINIDDNGNGQLDVTAHRVAAEPVAYLQVPIAKAVNYVALGDSYSSGENGDEPVPGAYQAGKSPADGECRRWDQAYPNIFDREVLRNPDLAIESMFTTFACTGALTLNIYDLADPDGDSLLPAHAATNRPSPHAPRTVPLRDEHGQVVLHPSPGWEPRQSVSLGGAHTELKQSMQNVDMITLTIGGNDAGFSDRIVNCALVRECDPALAVGRLADIEQSVVNVLARVKEVAPKAAVFVLGYPYLTPEVDPCGNPREVRRLGPGRAPHIELDFSGLPEGCEVLWNKYFDAIDECESLSATGVVRGSYFYLGAALQAVLGGDRTRIDYREAKALWSAADDLNAKLKSAAERSGVHFVDVVGGVPLVDAPRGFIGRSSCNSKDPWLNGFVTKSGRGPAVKGEDGSTFHPTAAGQRGYADILEQYIRDAARASDVDLNEAGLPLNPEPRAGSSDAAPSQAGSATGSGAAAQAAGSVGLLLVQPATQVSGCGAPFVSPGGKVTLAAAGFAAGAAVSFTTRAVSLGDAQLTAPVLAAVTANTDGAVNVAWTVPTAPSASVDAAPRAYMVDASGLNSNGGTHSAVMGLPLVAYPATTPCAKDDTAATTLGQSVQIAVLGNDVAPTGGSLNAASVEVRAARGGGFAVNTTAGAVTFTPDPGFRGTVETSYVVYDGWGIGVEADLSVTVDAGCTITGASGARTIEGTSGDDVICVPDPEDRRAFHVIDAKGGDDVILGGAGVEWVYGGAGADTIYGRGNADRIIAGPGVDSVYGGTGTDYIYSSDLEDTIIDDSYEMVFAAPAATQSGPQTVDDWAWVAVSRTTSLDVLGNDHDPNDDLDAASLRITRLTTAGTAAVVTASDGRTVVDYSAAGTGGNDSFGYEVCDALGRCAWWRGSPRPPSRPASPPSPASGASPGCTTSGAGPSSTSNASGFPTNRLRAKRSRTGRIWSPSAATSCSAGRSRGSWRAARTSSAKSGATR